MIKVLVATKEGQGKRATDFSWTTEGELVTFTTECDGEKVDGRCGCRRSMCGMESIKATTTMKVVEKDMTRDQFKAAVRAYFDKSGWGRVAGSELEKMIEEDTTELLRIGAVFSVGRIVEKRGPTLQVRSL